MSEVEMDLNVDLFWSHIRREMRWKQTAPMIADKKDSLANEGIRHHLKNSYGDKQWMQKIGYLVTSPSPE